MKKLLFLFLATLISLCSFAQKGQEEYEKGMTAYENHLYVEAVSWLEKSAGQGNAEAQFLLGVCYRYIWSNSTEAKYWYKKAAEQGHEEAIEELKSCVNINSRDNNTIKYLKNPVSYENKKETSFKVFRVFDDAALAREISDTALKLYLGKTVLILGETFYDGQVVTFKNPQRLGTYSYGYETVPVINVEMK